MKKILFYTHFFLLALLAVACSNETDAILEPKEEIVTRAGDGIYMGPSKVPYDVVLCDTISFIFYDGNLHDQLLDKLREKKVEIYNDSYSFPHQYFDWELDFYGTSNVRFLWAKLNFKELEKMDEVVYAAPFCDLISENESIYGYPNLRGLFSYFDKGDSKQNELAKQLADEYGMYVRRGLYDHNEIVFLMNKDTKIFIVDALKLFREKGIPVCLPNYGYTHEAWAWYIP